MIDGGPRHHVPRGDVDPLPLHSNMWMSNGQHATQLLGAVGLMVSRLATIIQGLGCRTTTQTLNTWKASGFLYLCYMAKYYGKNIYSHQLNLVYDTGLQGSSEPSLSKNQSIGTNKRLRTVA